MPVLRVCVAWLRVYHIYEPIEESHRTETPPPSINIHSNLQPPNQLTLERPPVLVQVRRDGGDPRHAEVPGGQRLPQLLEEGEEEAAEAGVHF